MKKMHMLTGRVAVLVLTCFLLFSSGCQRQNNLPGLFVVPEFRELGVVSEDSVTMDFEVCNNTGRAVKIRDVFPSCRCSTAKFEKNPIPAGEVSRLTLEANLSGLRNGKKTFSVLFTTDCESFPRKTASFSAWISSTTASETQVAIGRFYPGQKIQVPVPLGMFTQGEVSLNPNETNNTRIEYSNDLAAMVLVLDETAPVEPGQFVLRQSLHETFPEQPAVEKNEILLELTGEVLPRWKVAAEVFGGVRQIGDTGGFKFTLVSNFGNLGKQVSSVSCLPGDSWVKMKDFAISAKEIEVDLEMQMDQLNVGPSKTELRMSINYHDGSVEEYTTSYFTYLSKDAS